MEPAPVLEPEQARFRLFDSITNFLKNAAQSQPLMLVLDDLHWADHSSLMFWEFVSKEISNARVMLLGAYRHVEVGRRHPLAQVVAGPIVCLVKKEGGLSSTLYKTGLKKGMSEGY